MPHAESDVLYANQKCTFADKVYLISSYRGDWLVGLETNGRPQIQLADSFEALRRVTTYLHAGAKSRIDKAFAGRDPL